MHQYDAITSHPTDLLFWLQVRSCSPQLSCPQLTVSLQELRRTGLTIIKKVPLSQAGLDSVVNLVGQVKWTHYGQFWNVRSKPDANNLAYTGASLGLHTDLPYYDYTPGVQCLHCLSQAPAQGGENVFADGFAAAEKIRADFPAQFELLRISSGDSANISFH